MSLTNSLRKILLILGAFLAAWLGIKYLLPVLLPFLMGLVVALAAEPAVSFGIKKLRLPRGVAAGLGVTLTLIFLTGMISLLGALAVRELGTLAGKLPDVTDTVQQGMHLLQDRLVGVTEALPDGVRTMATATVLEVFDDGNLLLSEVTGRLPGMVSSLLSWLPNGALGLGTGILAGFLISARLPRLRQGIAARIPAAWKEKYLPALRRVRKSLGGWLKAQGKLAAVTYCIVTTGFLVLGVKYGPAWAVLVALVDAVPVLGTGTVLVPWAVVLMLQNQLWKGLGILGIWGAAVLTRTVLEPKLVGKHLGLDPLATLLFLYVGYRFWGILGMIFAPMLAAAAKTITAEQ